MLRNDDEVGVVNLGRLWESRLSSFRARHTEQGDIENGLQFPKHPLMQMEGHPFDTVAWLTAPIDIKDEAGKVIFADNVEFPETWGERDKQVVASKYFFGDHGQGFRETSLKQMLTRVSCTIALWALDNGTFRSPSDAENFLNYLIMIQLHQEFAFNSPVYFNVGVHCYGLDPSPENYIWDEESQGVIPCPDANIYPQISACFIQSVEDNMQSIMKLATSEAMLFKRGSGCLDPNTLVLTDRGLVRLVSFGDDSGAIWRDIETEVQTDEGPRMAVKFYRNGLVPTLRVRTKQGSELIGTPNHKVKVVQVDGSWAWSRIDDLRPGDILPLRIGGMIGEPCEVPLLASSYSRPAVGMPARPVNLPVVMTSDLAVLIGNFMGNGSLHSRSLRWIVAQTDGDVRDYLVGLIQSTFGQLPVVRDEEGYWEINVNSKILRDWWEANGFAKMRIAGKSGKGSGEPRIPDAVLDTNDPLVYGAFLRGLFEADGGTNKSIPYISTSYSRFSQQVRSVLLVLGLPSRTFECIPGVSSKGGGVNYQVGLRNATYNSKFQEMIGFIGLRKSEKVKNPSGMRQSGKNDLVWLSDGDLDNFISLADWGQGKAAIQLARKNYGGAMTRNLARRIFVALGDARLGKVLNYAFETVSAVEDAGERETVDLSVLDNHTYIASGFITHNTGTDLSTLRSSREKLSGGGVPSGPVSFMGMYDRIAAIVKSGGKTRRAAKMQTIKYWHPDIWQFVECKPQMERMARDLIAAGYPKDFNGLVYSTVLYQNANLSVRVDDSFMAAARGGGTFDTRAVTTGNIVATYPAEKLLDAIAAGSHDCGDPALQFEDTIQRWHTCPNTAPINSSNPCSEYMFLNDTACNLASLNLLRFRDVSGQSAPSWNRDHLFNTCRVAATAMETMVGRASYPTPEIALNSHRFRPLGGGYCNLGALLMVRGLPYDSPAGRLLGAALASLVTATFYLTSADLARLFGAFDGYAVNADAMMNVIEMHRQNFMDQRKELESADGITVADLNLFDLIQGVWRNAIFMGRSWGYRNSQGTCIAPTGTIGFMMGCDTLGIEPETALVRYKHLAGGGVLKLVNICVPESLRGLGYSPEDIAGIVKHMSLYGTIEDVILERVGPAEIQIASGLKPEHLPVFDCAFPPAPGEVDGRKFRPREGRSIAPGGHVRMMGQATGCVSGAISKTVNMPASSTVEDIKNIYFDAWVAGCKSISVYRDGSKGDQPVSTSAPVVSRPVPVAAPVLVPGLPARFRMPDDRQATIHKFNIMGHEGFITVGLTPDGQPGEVFIEVAKQGSTVGGLMGVIGTLISLLLQHYVPMSKIVEKLAGQNFEPRGITKNINIRFCKSIVDYLGQYLGSHFVPGFQAGKNPLRADGATSAASSGPDALEESLPAPLAGYAANLNGSICSACGEIMVRVGQNCEICSCGHTEGGCGG
jgi:ribonucleoside-diphosphate reductase alpha chain